jgi:GNAT superfamily N-acetyltransferase
VIAYKISPKLENAALNRLFSSAWGSESNTDFTAQLERALFWVAAFDGAELVGFVKIIGDGGVHGFLLDTSVCAEYKHQGIGSQLLRLATLEARERGCGWLHVDFEPHLEGFYRRAGFGHTAAGLIQL